VKTNNNNGTHNTVKIRSLKGYSKARFVQKLNEVNWQETYECDDVDTAWCSFRSTFMAIIDSVAPSKEIRLKHKTEPWMSSDILDFINKREFFLSKFRKSKNVSDYDRFVWYRNNVNYKKRVAKSEYFENLVSESRNQPKQLWQALKSLGASSKTKSQSKNIGLHIDDTLCFDNSKVANYFNSFFTTIASNLVAKLPTCTGRFGLDFITDFYARRHVVKNAFRLQEVSRDQILKHLNGISPKKATGLDKIPARFIKDGADVIAGPISTIVNMSLRSGRVPHELKTARVVPLHKKNSKTDAGNYRPISILNIMSKVFERVVFNQLNTYLVHNKLLFELQSGFREKFSTDTCLIHLHDYIRLECDKGHYTGMVLLDLQKAFDTVNHDILVLKLKALGVDEISLQWFRSYLSDRKQIVQINGDFSDPCNVECGVPQGSILGPLLFLVYINDMEAVVNCKLMLYADDSALLVSGKSIPEIEEALSAELKNVQEWLIDNKLSLHLGKTESILFASKRRLSKCGSLVVRCGGADIESKTQVTYLGMILDQSLSGEHFVNNIISKTSKKVKFLYRNCRGFDLKTKKMLVSSLVQCQFDYACSSWFSGLTKKYKSRLQISQNKVVRFMLGLSPWSHIGADELKLVNMLPVEYRVKQLKANHLHNIFNGEAPAYMLGSFVRSDSGHQTRNQNLSFFVPRINSFGHNSFTYTGAKLWNSFPQVIRGTRNKSHFKKLVRDFLASSFMADSLNTFVFY